MKCNCAKLTVHGNNYCCYLPTVIDPNNMPSTFWVVVCECGSQGLGWHVVGSVSQSFQKGTNGTVETASWRVAVEVMSTTTESDPHEDCCKTCCHRPGYAVAGVAAGKVELRVTSAVTTLSGQSSSSAKRSDDPLIQEVLKRNGEKKK